MAQGHARSPEALSCAPSRPVKAPCSEPHPTTSRHHSLQKRTNGNDPSVLGYSLFHIKIPLGSWKRLHITPEIMMDCFCP